MKYDYSFCVWPCEGWGHPKELFDVFRMYGRLVLTFTSAEFEAFRSSLDRAGFGLREVERVPYHEPESIL